MEIFDVKENYDIAATLGSGEFILCIFISALLFEDILNSHLIAKYIFIVSFLENELSPKQSLMMFFEFTHPHVEFGGDAYPWHRIIKLANIL